MTDVKLHDMKMTDKIKCETDGAKVQLISRRLMPSQVELNTAQSFCNL